MKNNEDDLELLYKRILSIEEHIKRSHKDINFVDISKKFRYIETTLKKLSIDLNNFNKKIKMLSNSNEDLLRKYTELTNKIEKENRINNYNNKSF